MDWKDELYERTKNEKTVFNMKTFKVEGWYRYNDEKDFETEIVNGFYLETALAWFMEKYKVISFYKIDIKEIV
jgi:hypothetical protein